MFFATLQYLCRKKAIDMEAKKKLNKLGEWLASNAKPLIDVSGLTSEEKKQWLKAVLK